MTTNSEAAASTEITASDAFLDCTPFQLRKIATYYKVNVTELDPFAFLVAMQWAFRDRQGEKGVTIAHIEHNQTVRQITSFFADDPDDDTTDDSEKEPVGYVEPDPNE